MGVHAIRERFPGGLRRPLAAGLRRHGLPMLVGLALAALYLPVLVEAARMWLEDGHSAHGFFVPGLAGLLVWWKRRELAQAARRPSAWGFAPLLLGLALQMVAWYARIRMAAMLSLVPVLLGLALLLWGAPVTRLLRFPILFLVFAAPLPQFLILPVSFPIQNLSTRAACGGMRELGVPLTQEGFTIGLPNATVEVTEECSGFRKTLALLVFTSFYASLFAVPLWRQALLVLLAVPVALLANVLRVSSLILAGAWGGETGARLFHTPSEALVVGLCAALIFGVGRLLGCRKLRYTG